MLINTQKAFTLNVGHIADVNFITLKEVSTCIDALNEIAKFLYNFYRSTEVLINCLRYLKLHKLKQKT